jgi:hypothetical protein
MNKPSLKLIGVWNDRLLVYPNPHSLLGSSLSADIRERVAKYIESLPSDSFRMAVPFARERYLLNHQHQERELLLKSDGTWLFPESLADYIREGVDVPSEFIVAATAQGCGLREIPSTCWEQGIDELFWIYWSLSHIKSTYNLIVYLSRLCLWFPIYFVFLGLRKSFGVKIW